MEIRLGQCKRCPATFLVCRPCDRVRWYCAPCKPEATSERLERARKKYRESPEGKEQHASEEKDRRDRLRGAVGDQGRAEEKVPGTVRCQEVAPVPEPQRTEEIAEAALCEVTLVFAERLRRVAEALVGCLVACSECGRSGLVTRLRRAPAGRWQ